MNRQQRRHTPLTPKQLAEAELAQHPGIRDALLLLASLHIATKAPDFDAEIGLEDKVTKDVRTFRIHVDVTETTPNALQN